MMRFFDFLDSLLGPRECDVKELPESCDLKPASAALKTVQKIEKQRLSIIKGLQPEIEKLIICGIESASKRGDRDCLTDVTDENLDLFNRSQFKKRLEINGYSIDIVPNPVWRWINIDGTSVPQKQYIRVSWGE